MLELDPSAVRAFDLCAEVVTRCDVRRASGARIPSPPRPRDFAREILGIELARRRAGVPVDRADVVQAALWQLAPVSDR